MKTTSNVLFAAFIIIAIGAMGCSNDSKFEITGQWKYAAWTMGERQVDLVTLGTPIIDFNQDGTFKATLGTNSSSEKWQMVNDTLSLIYSDGNTQQYVVNAIAADSIELQGDIGEMNTKLTLVKTK